MKTNTYGLAIAAIVIGSVLGTQAQVASRWSGATNNLWSVAANWQLGIPGIPEGTTTNIAQFGTMKTNIVVDVPTTGLTKLNFQSNSKNHTFSGDPIDIYPGQVVAVENNGTNINSVQTINNDITLHYDAGDKTVQLNNTADGLLIFNGFVDCSSNDFLKIYGKISLNGGVAVTNLQCYDTATFSNVVDNVVSDGFYLNLANANATVFTPSNTVFYDGPRIWFNNINTRLTLNSSDVLGDGTELYNGQSGRNCYVTFNGNEKLGYLTANGRFYITLGDDVTSLAFANSRSRTWTDGVVISNFQSYVVSFGTNSLGLNTNQLSKITAYDSTGTQVTNLILTSEGFLASDGEEPPFVPAGEIGDITLTILPGNTQLTVAWNTTNGAIYAVESNTDLVFGEWVDVATNLVGTGGTLIVTNAVDENKIFYRVYSDH